jgi:hypothetical protein|tara:strand:- start:328 stop:699 length:372 start_codon:yes stop_codon:yes gene_type:complete
VPSRRRNTPRERATRSKSAHSRAEILSEHNANDFTREVSPNGVVHSNTNAQVLDLSQGRKRGLKNVKAGLENFNLIPLRAQTHATRTIKTNSLLLTFSRPSTFVFKTRKMCWKSSPTIKAMMR